MKRHSDSTDELNLKTPSSAGIMGAGGGGSGPQPHPSWVYRNNYAPFNPNPKNPVKRSLSLLGSTVAAAANGGIATTHKFEQLLNNHHPTGNRYEQHGNLTAKPAAAATATTTRNKMFDLSSSPPAEVHGYSKPVANQRNGNVGSGERGGGGAGQMRHAVIRRHQSMYIHPRTTTEITPASFGVGGGGTTNMSQPYKLHDVPGGKSEVRPIVTVKRSKTTAASLHYKATSIQALHKNTFGAANNGGKFVSSRTSNVRDYNHNTIPHPVRRKPSNAYNATEELCEFQVIFAALIFGVLATFCNCFIL